MPRNAAISTPARLLLMAAVLLAIFVLSRGARQWASAAPLGQGTIFDWTVPQKCAWSQSEVEIIPIPDNEPAGVTTTVTINLPNPNARIWEARVRLDWIEHQYTSDLRIKLKAPSGQTVILVGDPGIAKGNPSYGVNFYGTTLYDGAATWIMNGIPPYSGGYRPFQALAVLRSQPANGVWELNVADVVDRDAGKLGYWKMELCTDRLYLPRIMR